MILQLIFQYFNCIGGIEKKKTNFKRCYISILQLYRWNAQRGVFIAWLIKFQYFNCIGGIILIQIPLVLFLNFNTSTVSVECTLRAKCRNIWNISILQLYRWNIRSYKKKLL